MVSAIMFTLAVGFAGGLENVFSHPEGDAASITLAVIAWTFMLFPVVAFPVVLFVQRRK